MRSSNPWSCFSPFLDQLRFKAAVAISRDLQRYVSVNGAHRLGTFAIAGVAGVLAVSGMFGVAQVGRHLGFPGPFGQALGQLLEQTALAEDIVRAGAARQ